MRQHDRRERGSQGPRQGPGESLAAIGLAGVGGIDQGELKVAFELFQYRDASATIFANFAIVPAMDRLRARVQEARAAPRPALAPRFPLAQGGAFIILGGTGAPHPLASTGARTTLHDSREQ